MPKVSVIIPTYNVEPYLVECMESITHQTLDDIEIICINDGSTDNSLAILKEYAAKDDRIILIDKKNEGYGIGMNTGMERATGEYIGILEPDDNVAINMYGDLYAIAKENDLDFVKADFYRFVREENDNMYLVYNHLTQNKDEYNTVFNPSEHPETLRYIMNTWSGIYKKEFLDNNNIRHHETPGAAFQDNGFWFQTFIYGKRAMIVNKPYYHNRRDNPNSSIRSFDKLYCINKEYDYIKDILMRDPVIWERFKYMYTYKKFMNYKSTVRRVSDEHKMQYIDRFREEIMWAKTKGELDETLFIDKDITRMEYLFKSSKAYYDKYGKERAAVFTLKERLDRAQGDLEEARQTNRDIKNTVTFKAGKAVMFLPHQIKKRFKHSKTEE